VRGGKLTNRGGEKKKRCEIGREYGLLFHNAKIITGKSKLKKAKCGIEVWWSGEDEEELPFELEGRSAD